MFDKLIGGLVKTVSETVDDPINKAVEMATQPIRDGLDVIDGLTEGELREKAAIRLGIDIASSMIVSELVEWYRECGDND